LSVKATSEKGGIVEKLVVDVIEDQLSQLRGGDAGGRRHAGECVNVGGC
jgi:hypothetical protein